MRRRRGGWNQIKAPPPSTQKHKRQQGSTERSARPKPFCCSFFLCVLVGRGTHASTAKLRYRLARCIMRIASGIVVPRSAPCFTFSFFAGFTARPGAGGGVGPSRIINEVKGTTTSYADNKFVGKHKWVTYLLTCRPGE
jgi:hypothetical protein